MPLCERSSEAAPVVQDLVNQFDSDRYYDLVANKLYTRQGMNRAPGIGPENPLCREAIYAELQSYGYTAYKDQFDYVDTSGVPRIACNVIAIKPGVRNPDNEIFVVGSHFDSEDNPGADDNATGVAALLEMARIFNQHNFAKTIVFCAFDAEEVYDYYGARRLGSSRYVSQHLNDNIKGMVSVDMIGWQASGSSSNQAYIEGRSTMAVIRNELRLVMQTYGGGIVPVLRSTSGDLSDHVAFANAGFQACLFIEGYFSSNPNYHKLTDYVEMPGYIDWIYAGKMAKTAIAYFATKAEIVDTNSMTTTLFRDEFETSDSANNWLLFEGSANGIPDYTVDWSFDYSTYHSAFNGTTIPPAPNTTNGTTRGLKLTVNNNDITGALAAVSLYPNNLVLSNGYSFKVDMWMNYPGGPGGSGSTGSTETATIGINHSGTRVNWQNGNPSDGLFFGFNGEGGVTDDYLAYAGNAASIPTKLSFAASGLVGVNNTHAFFQTIFPASQFETAGTPGKRWVEVELSQDVNNIVALRMNGHLVALRTNSSPFIAGTVMLGYMDLFASIATPAADAFVIFDNARVEATQPVSAPIINGFGISPGGEFQLQFSGVAGGTYSVLSTTNNLETPIDWTVVGTATEQSPGQFEFIAPDIGTTQRYFRLRQP
ncbi:MAG: M28 family peptidase [Verrucomicrobia bacterium]|nr:M28 family peptidase [Verrucomicrobiota bacterium]